MRLASLLVVLGGCMRIYADPELPDLEVEWYEGDCRENTGDVELVLTSPDDADERLTARVPCTERRVAFPDVQRVRYHVEGVLLVRDGRDVFTRAMQDVDLRNGFDGRADLYFGGFDNFFVRWEFAGGATCASVGADYIAIQPFSIVLPCVIGGISSTAPEGMYDVVLEAQTAEGAVVARSAAVPVTLDSSTLTDLGTIILAP